GRGEALGQPVLVENMAGVGGIAGGSRVAKAAPDGYQFVVGNVGTHAQNQFLFAYPPYDAAVEFVPAALLVDQVMLVAVRADLPIDSLNNFIALLTPMRPRCSTPRPASGRRLILLARC